MSSFKRLKDVVIVISLIGGFFICLALVFINDNKVAIESKGILDGYMCEYLGGKGKNYHHKFSLPENEYTFTSKQACSSFKEPEIGREYNFSYLEDTNKIIKFGDVITEREGNAERKNGSMALYLMSLIFLLLAVVKVKRVYFTTK
ncbi:hypothetical protein [Pseudoalteromonas rubra]|uniref:DUF3592 domain-containing protein n=1 Tax=Pseudoalteromonas rubra TaxID=43658 RepID=A0A0U3HTD6_9GAMM|nr:hypothetical protein [Pseudoalteromonas rubra]ALU44681.1 hypothetical protein AT705_18080 [Pseudoalteromonas rubra]